MFSSAAYVYVCSMKQYTGRAKYVYRIQEVLARAPKGVLLRPIDSLVLKGRAFHELRRSDVRQIGDLVSTLSDSGQGGLNLGVASLRDVHAALVDVIEKYVFASCGASESYDQSEDVISTEAVYDVDDVDDADDIAPGSSALLVTEAGQTFSQLLDWGLDAIGERYARVISERSGMYGPPKTLEAVARPTGLTRERVRQIQNKAMLRLTKHAPVASMLEEKLLQLLDGRGSPLYLAGLPAEDSWFEGTKQPETVLDFLIDNIPGTKLGTIVLHGRRVVTKGPQGEWDRRVHAATAFVKERCGVGLTDRALMVAIEAIAGDQFRELSSELFKLATKHAIFADVTEGRILVAFGRGASQKVLAILESSDTPLHYSEIARRVSDSFGKVEVRRVQSAADDVGLLLGRGIYGLRKHIHISDTEAAYLASLCEEMLREGLEDRQWHASEMLSELRETEPLAEKLSHFELSILLKEHSDLTYLGRQVWLYVDEVGGQPQKRLDLQNAVEAALREAGTPLAAFEIFRRISSIRGVGAHFQVHPKGVVFRVGPSTWGLTTRDLMISDQDLRQHLEQIAKDLDESRSAIHVSEIREKLGLSGTDDEHAWQVFGAAQLDPRFKSFFGDYLGLAGWSETGRVAVHDAVKLAIEDLTAGATVESIQDHIEVSLGRRVSTDTVKSALRDRGATYDRLRGVWVLDLANEADEEGRDPAEI